MDMMEQAFPTTPANYESKWADAGMTLRDYFAAHALPTVARQYLAHPAYAAEEAYKFADAMLEARKT